MKAVVPAPEAASTPTQQTAGFFMFYCKAKNKRTKNSKTACSLFTLSLLWLSELGCLLTRQALADTQGPRSSIAEALQLYDDCLHLNLALW